jgi:Carboxypeptidase regulatory-like domain
MVDGQPREAVTDSIGRFRIDSVAAGQYRVGVFHPILDSLGTSLASRPVRFTAGKPMLISLSTPSGRTIRRAFCPEMAPRAPRYEHADSGVAILVGRVLDPDSDTAIPDATVTLSWVETVFDGAALNVTPYARTATTSPTGDFRFCALPTGLSGLLRAATGSNDQSVVERELSLESRIVTMATVHLSGAAKSQTPLGHAVLTGEIQRPDGSPFVGATAILEGTRDSAVSDSTGTFTMRGLPPGTHMVLVRSVGFEPVSDVVELTDRDPQHVSVALITPARVLSPVVIEARRLAAAYARVGFDRRQRGGTGRFLTAGDIASRHAVALSQLLAGLPGLQMSSRSGSSKLESDRGAGSCLAYMLDGQTLDRGTGNEVDAMLRPDQIGAIEVYSPASVPEEFSAQSAPAPNAVVTHPERKIPGSSPTRITSGSEAHSPQQTSTACTTVVIWTKSYLGLQPDDTPTEQ